MKCLHKYPWVKFHRSQIPSGKGVMGSWMRLAAQVAYRTGNAKYCEHINKVSVGEWVGGIVGVKAMLGLRSKKAAMGILNQLSEIGLIEYTLDPITKRLAYRIPDWVQECSAPPAGSSKAVYATNQVGFICVPRSISQRLVDAGLRFDEMDAWLDLWVHTVSSDPANIFSMTAPVVQYAETEIALTLEKLGVRWKWEKTKVWRFFRKYSDTFALARLPGSQGCVIVNRLYDRDVPLDESGLEEEFVRILGIIRTIARNAYSRGTDHERVNMLLVRYSRTASSMMKNPAISDENDRVALFAPITRAYLSPALLVYHALKITRSVYDCRWILTAIPRAYYARGP